VAIAGIGKIIIATDNAILNEANCTDHAGFIPGEYVTIAVTDNGPGIDNEILGYIFEPFFTTKNPGKGTGLGLSTVYGIVKQNNGFIDVCSEPGCQTTFKIYLPRSMGKKSSDQTQLKAISLSGGKETVLLVEDETALLALGKRILESLGYCALTARTPGEAIQLAEQHSAKIHLLLRDIVMPEMNGWSLAKHLILKRPEIKRLFMSGYSNDMLADQNRLGPNVHNVQKPYSMQTLANKVREALDGAPFHT
jgi:two-component system, cell cycle sensor histidine kinase and response regulator CckA